MKAFELLDEMVQELEESPKAVFSKNRTVDVEVFMEMIDDLRASLPDEIVEAQKVLSMRDSIIASATEEAKSIVAEADARVSALVDEQELTRQAQLRAREITETAQKNAAEVREGVTDYADELLARLESDIKGYLEIVRQNRRELGEPLPPIKSERETPATAKTAAHKAGR